MQQSIEDRLPIENPVSILAILITSAVLAAVTLLILGIDITPATSWPTPHVYGPYNDPTYLPPAR